MAHTDRPVCLSNSLLVAVLGVLGLTLVLIATSKYGAGLSADSASYVSTAASVLAGRGFVRYDSTPLVDFPPLLPTVLAALGSLDSNLYAVGRYVNAACCALIVFATGVWLLGRTSSLRYAALGGAAVLLGKPIFLVSSFVWSEPLFILCSLGFLFSIEHFIQYGDVRTLLIAAALTALAFLTRYIGAAVVVTGLILILSAPRRSLSRRVANAGLFGCVSLVPGLAWMARNYLVSSTPTGTRAPASFGALLNIYFTLDTISQWLLPVAIPSRNRILLAVLILGAVMAAALWWIRRGDRWTEMELVHLLPPACFTGIYTLALLVLASRTAFDRIDDRLLSPIYTPLVLIVVAVVARLHRCAPEKSASRWRRLVGIGVAALWLALSAWRLVGDVRSARANGAGGYATTAWHDSEIVRYIRGDPGVAGSYTNNPEAMYMLAGLPAKSSPRKYLYNSAGSRTDDLAQFEVSVAADPGLPLVWFDNVARPFLYSLPELGIAVDLEPVVEKQGGAVYRMVPKQR